MATGHPYPHPHGYIPVPVTGLPDPCYALLLHVQGRPMFPKLCNPRRSLACSDCVETTMHRKKLQRRLQRGDLSPAEARSIAPFAGRRNAIKERNQMPSNDVAMRVGRVQSRRTLQGSRGGPSVRASRMECSFLCPRIYRPTRTPNLNGPALHPRPGLVSQP